MSKSDDEFLNELRATFKVEAAEHVQAIATGLVNLEKTPAPEIQRGIVDTVFRAAHSLKGAARAVDFTEIESLCQEMEDMFAAWKRPDGVLSPGAFDAAHRTLDAITGVLSVSDAARVALVGTPASAAQSSLGQTRARSEDSIPGEECRRAASTTTPFAEQKIPFSEDTIRIAVAKLDARLLGAEEMLTAKLTAGQRVEDLRDLSRRFEAWRNEWTAVESEARELHQAIDRPAPGSIPPGPAVVRLLEFLDWNREHLKALESEVTALARKTEQDHHVVGKLVDDLLADSKKLLLLPFGTVTASFPKMVRDLCRDQGKEAELVIRGEEVELDKRILEELKDPLIHLLRNCVDHGIETPETRTRLGKPARATITLGASPLNGSKVEVLVYDDGAGIDIEKVKASAVEHGFVPAADAAELGEAAALALIFQADVSTSPIITRLSGRGLGLAIVREKADRLGGTVSVESQPRQGTRFRIVVPSMLATFRGILVEAAGQLFVAPTAHVERVARVQPGDVQTVEGRETIALGGRIIGRVRLADVLELPSAERDGDAPASVPVIVLGAGDQHIAFEVDAVLDEQEVLVKPLRKPLSRVRNISGATVLGSGRVAPVLNVADLLKSARRVEKGGGAAPRAPAGTKAVESKSILVAEDSITSRTLIKGILESAGYKVKTAVDGMEAFALLRAEKFDLLVSDVEMPRLNGFALAARVRADKKLAELPVVLVTALETREDRERGIDAGANAYIVKSSFDQSNLLDAVHRLV